MSTFLERLRDRRVAARRAAAIECALATAASPDTAGDDAAPGATDVTMRRSSQP